MLKNGSISLTYASLMSLQVDISQQDVDYIKPLDPGFHEYWLHDEVIDSYLEWLSLRHTSISLYIRNVPVTCKLGIT